MTKLEKILYLKLYDKICPICDKICTDKRRTTRHISEEHIEIMNVVQKFKEIYKNNVNKENIECPICKNTYKEMARHLRKKHNISVEEFRFNYPLIPLKVSSSFTKNSEVRCHICDKIFKTSSGLGSHYKIFHNKYFEQNKENNKVDFHYVCPICSRNMNNIRQHIGDFHNIDWKFFCEKYNWNIKESKYVSDKYRENLSRNKKKFYASDKGKQLRKIQSSNMTGDKNFACRPEVRSKISKSAIKRMNDNPFFNHSYGIKFKFMYKDNKYFARSFEELNICYHLLKNNIKFEYEKTRIKYLENGTVRTYVLDFEINGEYYEVKSSLTLSKENTNKYDLVQNSLNKIDKKLHIVTIKELSEVLNFHISIEGVYKFCRKALSENRMWITNYTYCKNSRILNIIDKDYKINPNIKYILKEKK